VDGGVDAIDGESRATSVRSRPGTTVTALQPFEGHVDLFTDPRRRQCDHDLLRGSMADGDRGRDTRSGMQTGAR